jgi:hypothetical protein
MERYLRNIEKEINKNYHGDIDYYCDKQSAKSNYLTAVANEIRTMLDKFEPMASDNISTFTRSSNILYRLVCLYCSTGAIDSKILYARLLRLHYLRESQAR